MAKKPEDYFELFFGYCVEYIPNRECLIPNFFCKFELYEVFQSFLGKTNLLNNFLEAMKGKKNPRLIFYDFLTNLQLGDEENKTKKIQSRRLASLDPTNYNKSSRYVFDSHFLKYLMCRLRSSSDHDWYIRC